LIPQSNVLFSIEETIKMPTDRFYSLLPLYGSAYLFLHTAVKTNSKQI
jgi:hypothetical protein